MQQPTELVLPDLFSLTLFSWSARNPLFSPDNRELTEWMLSYGIFTDHKHTRMDALNAEMLGAYAYPYADAKELHIASNFLVVLFMLDEITNAQNTEGAKTTCSKFVKALTGKTDDGVSAVTLFTKDYLKCISGASDEVHDRFVTHCITYIDATVDEACLHANNEVPSIEEYTRICRNTGGILPCFDLIEVLLGITLPAEVFEDSNFLGMYFAMNDMICLANDVYSYSIEYANGLEGCNIINVIIQSKGLSLNEAMDHVAELYKDLADTVMSCKENIHSFGPEADQAICSYVYGMEQWVYGNLA